MAQKFRHPHVAVFLLMMCVDLATTPSHLVRATATFSQVGIDIDGEDGGDRSGSSVAMSSTGTRIAIGAPLNDPSGNASAGHARVYDWDGTAWTQVGVDIDGEAADDRSGSSVAMSPNGTRIAIGAPLNDGNGTDSGHVRVYDWDGTAWRQVGVDIDGEAAADKSGSSVAMSSDGTRIAIGATENDPSGRTTAGHVRVYDWDGTAWTQAGGDIDGEAAIDRFGYSVAMSSGGTRIAIGAQLNDGNGANAGHVRVYDWDGTAWTQVGVDIDGEAAGDYSGSSVAMSSDGTRIAIGAQLKDGIGPDAGHVRVFASPRSLAITYDSHGGSAVSDGDTSTTTGGTIGALPTSPTRTGYTFTGWYTADSGGTHITTSSPHSQTADFTLHAQWTADTLAISYDSHGGSAVSDGDTSTTTGGTIGALPASPTRTGYTFTGWYTADSGGTHITTSSPHGQTADFTLHAQWTADTPATTTTTPPVVLPPAPGPTTPPTTTAAPTTSIPEPQPSGSASATTSDGEVISSTIEQVKTAELSVFTVRNSDGTELTFTHEPTRVSTAFDVDSGSTITVSGTGYQPDSDITVWLYSTPIQLGASVTNAAGEFTTYITVPADVSLGAHTLSIEGVTANGTNTTRIGITVSLPVTALPTTGPGSDASINVALILVALGILTRLRLRGLS